MGERELICLIVMAASFGACMLGAEWTYESGSTLADYMLYHFGHANVWHWAANALVLWRFRPRASTWIVAYAVSTAAAVIDSELWGMETCGMSALACAAVARKHAAWRNESGWRERTIMCLYGLAVFAVLPWRVNWHVHMIAFGMGYAVWRAWYGWKGRMRPSGEAEGTVARSPREKPWERWRGSRGHGGWTLRQCLSA